MPSLCLDQMPPHHGIDTQVLRHHNTNKTQLDHSVSLLDCRHWHISREQIVDPGMDRWDEHDQNRL
jgi:hypothetical protein